MNKKHLTFSKKAEIGHLPMALKLRPKFLMTAESTGDFASNGGKGHDGRSVKARLPRSAQEGWPVMLVWPNGNKIRNRCRPHLSARRLGFS